MVKPARLRLSIGGRHTMQANSAICAGPTRPPAKTTPTSQNGRPVRSPTDQPPGVVCELARALSRGNAPIQVSPWCSHGKSTDKFQALTGRLNLRSKPRGATAPYAVTGSSSAEPEKNSKQPLTAALSSICKRYATTPKKNANAAAPPSGRCVVGGMDLCFVAGRCQPDLACLASRATRLRRPLCRQKEPAWQCGGPNPGIGWRGTLLRHRPLAERTDGFRYPFPSGGSASLWQLCLGDRNKLPAAPIPFAPASAGTPF